MAQEIYKKGGNVWQSTAVREPATGKRISRRFETEALANAYTELCREAVANGAQYLPDPTAATSERTVEGVIELAMRNRYAERSENTQNSMRFQYQKIANFFGANSDFASTVNRNSANEYVQSLAHLATSSLNSAKSALNSLVREAYDQGFIDKTFKLRLIKPNNKTYNFFDEAAEQKLIMSCNGKTDARTILYRDLIRFIILTGLRLAEVSDIVMEDINGTVLDVIGKGDKPRKVPLTDEALKIVTSHGGFRGKFERAAFQQALRKAARQNNLKGSVHTLRHTTATRLAKRGASIRMVQEFMGHENIETTTRYMHLADNWGDDIRKLLD